MYRQVVSLWASVSILTLMPTALIGISVAIPLSIISLIYPSIMIWRIGLVVLVISSTLLLLVLHSRLLVAEENLGSLTRGLTSYSEAYNTHLESGHPLLSSNPFPPRPGRWEKL